MISLINLYAFYLPANPLCCTLYIHNYIARAQLISQNIITITTTFPSLHRIYFAIIQFCISMNILLYSAFRFPTAPEKHVISHNYYTHTQNGIQKLETHYVRPRSAGIYLFVVYRYIGTYFLASTPKICAVEFLFCCFLSRAHKEYIQNASK